MSEWEPATDAEAAMRDALRTDDQETYFRILAGVDLLLPVSADALAGHAPLGWGTWSTGGRTHVLAFTSPSALQACLADYTGSARRVPYAELADTWPNLEWWLAVNPGLPIEGYLPAWFVAQLARGDFRLPNRGPARGTGESAQDLHAAASAANAAATGEPGGPMPPTAVSARGDAAGGRPAPGQVGPGGLPIRRPGAVLPSGLPSRVPASGRQVGEDGSGGFAGFTPPGDADASPPSGGRPGSPRGQAIPPAGFDPGARQEDSASGMPWGSPGGGPPEAPGGTPGGAVRTGASPITQAAQHDPHAPLPTRTPTAQTPSEGDEAEARPDSGRGARGAPGIGQRDDQAPDNRQGTPTGRPDLARGDDQARGHHPSGDGDQARGGDRSGGGAQPGAGQGAVHPGPGRPAAARAEPHHGQAAAWASSGAGQPVPSTSPGDPLPRREPTPSAIGPASTETPAQALAGNRTPRTQPDQSPAQPSADPAGAPPVIPGVGSERQDRPPFVPAPSIRPEAPSRSGVRDGGAHGSGVGDDSAYTSGVREGDSAHASGSGDDSAHSSASWDDGARGVRDDGEHRGGARDDSEQATGVRDDGRDGSGAPDDRADASGVRDDRARGSGSQDQGEHASALPAGGAPGGTLVTDSPPTSASRWDTADEPDFVPANSVERDLLDAADGGSTDAFLSTLLLATVLVPVADNARPGSSPGESGLAFRTEEVDGERFLVVFTSRDRLAEHYAQPTRTVGVKFLELIRDWPDPGWSFAVNPGTPVGATYPGPQVIALASWAAEAGLGAEPEERDEGSAPLPQRAGDAAQHATIMQKTVPAEQVDYYLERGYDRVAGFVHRANEVEHLRTPAELFAALGLVHEGSPFTADAKEAFVLRWPAYRPSLYRIPYGGQSEQALRAMDGWVIERPPFRGNGFAPGEGRDVIAEFKVDSVRLPHGAQLWRIDADGTEQMIAIFDCDAPIWRKVGER